MTVRRFLIAFGATVFVGVGSIILINGVVDPWRYFRDSATATLGSDGRQQNPGLIRQKSFEVAFIGTSLDQNMRPDDIERIFGVSSVVLALSGGTAREQALTARLALREKPLRQIFWGLNLSAFCLRSDEIEGGSFPLYLYDDSVTNDLFYLFNASNTEKSLSDLFSQKGDPDSENWRNLYAWENERTTYGCPDLMEHQMKKRGLPEPESDLLLAPNEQLTSLSENLFILWQEHPKCTFTAYFPPYSRLYWGLIRDRQPHRFKAFQRIREEILTKALTFSNVRLFDFVDMDGAGDLANYKDLTHFHPRMNLQMLEMMGTDARRVSETSLESRLRVVSQWLDGYVTQAELDGCGQ
ncbi:MAG: hypothetical protein ACI8T1_001119 [Verrucomicrobiales bacterium]|jgi:hypothetical protein